MPEWRVPLADVEIGEAEIEAVADDLPLRLAQHGPADRGARGALRRVHGAEHAIAVTNGTAALHLICLAAGSAPGTR